MLQNQCIGVLLENPESSWLKLVPLVARVAADRLGAIGDRLLAPFVIVIGRGHCRTRVPFLWFAGPVSPHRASGYSPWLVETFCEAGQAGTSLRAANFVHIGRTAPSAVRPG